MFILFSKKGHGDINFKFVTCESCWKNMGSGYGYYGTSFCEKISDSNGNRINEESCSDDMISNYSRESY